MIYRWAVPLLFGTVVGWHGNELLGAGFFWLVVIAAVGGWAWDEWTLVRGRRRRL